MNSKLLTAIIAAALCANLTACDSNKKKEDPKKGTVLVVDKETQVAEVPVTAKDAKDSEVQLKIASAEDIAVAGEQLISATSFHLADQVLDLALQKDPANKRALFYKNILRPIMTLKGLAARLKPGFEQNGQESNFKDLVNAAPQSPLLDFAMASGKPAISNEKETQDALVEIRDAFIESVRWFKKNNDVSLVLNINPTTFADLIKEREQQEICYVEDTGDKNNLVCDPEFRKNLWTAKVNGADLLLIQQVYAGYALYLLPYTNYSVEGIQTIGKKLENMPVERAWEVFAADQNLFTLRKDHAFSFIKELGTDLKAATKWAIQYQDRLCTKNPHNRRGHIAEGNFCIEDTRAVETALVKLDRAMNGPIVSEVVVEVPAIDNYGYPYMDTQTKSVMVDYSVLWNNPIQDLKKTFAPIGFNECGKFKGLKDVTAGGLLPEGNADELIDSSCN